MFSTLLIAALASCALSAETFPAMCYDQAAGKAATIKCYTDQGLSLVLPDDPMNPDHIHNTSLQNGMTNTPEHVCKNKAAFDAAISCSLKLSDMCTPKAFKTLLPSEDNLKQIQNIMCANLASLNHYCTLNNTKDLMDCGQMKYGQMTVADANDPFKSTCTSYDHAEECLEEELQECGAENLAFQKQFNQLQAPIACQGSGAAVGK